MISGKTASSKGAKYRHSMVPYSESAVAHALALVTPSWCEGIALRDADGISSSPKRYAKANSLTYYTLINTWLLIIKQRGQRGALTLLGAIETLGLLKVIRDCDEAASALIANNFLQTEWSIPPYLVDIITQAGDDKEVLQYLRYPKRFSPKYADLIESASIQEFLDVNRTCKANARVGYPEYWVSRIRDRIHDMLRGFTFDPSKGLFSSGAIADSGYGRPLMDKLFAYSEMSPCLFEDPLYPISLGLQRPRTLDDFTSKVRAVPKSYKTARIIAMEHSYRQFYMQAIRLEMEECLSRNGYVQFLDLHDQGRNQDMARIGSISGAFATIDMSSASDSLSRALAYSVLPLPVCDVLDRYLPTRFVLPDGQRRIMHSFCTSGSAVTFAVESLFFLAVALEVSGTASALTKEAYAFPHVFGDDIVIDSRLFDTVSDVLERLGFRINHSKSYGLGSQYRESCGAEYVCGFDLVTRYWPRTMLSWTNADIAVTVAELCALQHKLYGSYDAQKFLAEVVRSFEPRMTSHTPGTDCVDLWESIPRFVEVDAPVLDGCVAPFKREQHLTLKTRRRNKLDELGPSGYPGWAVVDMWLYANFLKNGPVYESPLHRVLRVSTKPATPASHADSGEVYWAYSRE